MSKKDILIHFLFLVIFGAVFVSPVVVNAEYQKVSLGDTIRIGDFVYNDDYTPSGATCTVTIYDSNGVLKVPSSSGAMTNDPSGNGWHYFDYLVGSGEATGNWPASMSCGSSGTGDLVVEDRTFTVILTTASSNSNIASSVWGYGTKAITSLGNAAADVWDNSYASVRK